MMTAVNGWNLGGNCQQEQPSFKWQNGGSCPGADAHCIFNVATFTDRYINPGELK